MGCRAYACSRAERSSDASSKVLLYWSNEGSTSSFRRFLGGGCMTLFVVRILYIILIINLSLLKCKFIFTSCN